MITWDNFLEGLPLLLQSYLIDETCDVVYDLGLAKSQEQILHLFITRVILREYNEDCEQFQLLSAKMHLLKEQKLDDEWAVMAPYFENYTTVNPPPSNTKE